MNTVINNYKAVIPHSAGGTSVNPFTQLPKPVLINSEAKPGGLNEDQRQLLEECESDIGQNLQSFFVLGRRLEQIRDAKLYRADHKTFEAYCKEKWDFSKTHANRHIGAYLVEKHLKQLKDVYVPTKEAQVRWLYDLKPDEQEQVARKVFETVGEGVGTAGDFGEARQQLFPKSSPIKKKPKPIETATSENNGHQPALIFDTKVVSFAAVRKQLDDLYNIFTNSQEKQKGLTIISKLQKVIDKLVKIQAGEPILKEAV